MISIIRQKVGDKIYLYESVSVRNADGKPRNKRVPLVRSIQSGCSSYKNDVADAKESIRIYREKDVVEKGFLRFSRDFRV